MPDYKDKLAELLSTSQTMPFLFVGSGLSRRYLNLPNWVGLLEHFCEYADIAGKSYNYYFSRVHGSDHLPELATLLAEDFHEIWFRQDRFKDAVQRHKELGDIINLSSPLKIEVAEFIEENSKIIDPNNKYEEEIEELAKVSIDGIITTNWDRFLETVFGYRVYIGQQDLIFHTTQSIAEIYKIHGCCSEPNSLILTQEDYEEFSGKNAYLAAKLLTIFIEHPVVFIGYSLGDKNIRSILSAIFGCMNKDQIDHLQNRLIFVRRPTDTEEEGYVSAFIFDRDGKNIPVTEIRTHDFSQVYRVLQEKKRKIPARLLRSFKEELYNIILTQDPKNRLLADRITEDTNPSDVDFVLGLGLIEEFGIMGYDRFGRDVICQDVIFGTKKLNFEALIQKSLPSIAVKPSYVPIFKYLRLYGVVDDNELKNDGKIPDKLYKYASSRIKKKFYNASQEGSRPGYLKKYPDLKSVVSSCDVNMQLHILPVLEYGKDDLEELRQYLADNIGLMSDKKLTSAFCKLVCVYDLLKYGPASLNVEPVSKH